MTLLTLRNALLYNPGSVFSNVGALLLWEKGVQQHYALTAIDMKQEQDITPEFIRLNPAGKVPVLIHEGRSIPDSLAIAQFLDSHYNNNNDLGSIDDKVMATVEQWRQVRVLALWMGKKHPDQDTWTLTDQLNQSRQRVLDYQQQQQQQQQQQPIGDDTSIVDAYNTRLAMHDDRARVLLDHTTYLHHEQQWHRLLDTTDTNLAHQSYVAGDRFTLADVYATSFLYWMTQKVAPPSTVFAHRARLEQYYYRQLDRNSIRKAFCLSS